MFPLTLLYNGYSSLYDIINLLQLGDNKHSVRAHKCVFEAL